MSAELAYLPQLRFNLSNQPLQIDLCKLSQHDSDGFFYLLSACNQSYNITHTTQLSGLRLQFARHEPAFYLKRRLVRRSESRQSLVRQQADHLIFCGAFFSQIGRRVHQYRKDFDAELPPHMNIE